MKPSRQVKLAVELKKGQFLVTSAILLTCGIGILLNDFYLTTKSEKQVLVSTAHLLTEDLISTLMFRDEKEAEKSISSIREHPNFSHAFVFDNNKKLFASYPKGSQFDDLKVQRRLSDEFAIMADGEKLGTLILATRNEINPWTVLGYAAVALAVLVVGFAVAQITSRIVARKIQREIKTLLSVIREISCSGNYGLSVAKDSKKEIQIEEIHALAIEFDSMLAIVQKRDCEIRDINLGLESIIDTRTLELKQAQAGLVQSSKMSALGEMAAGLAHEINNPLAIIAGKSGLILRLANREPFDKEGLEKNVQVITATVNRIVKIIRGLRAFSRDGTQDPFENCKLKTIIDDTLELCKSRFENHGVKLVIEQFDPELTIACRATQIGQVILNLFNNGHDAVSQLNEKWVRFEVQENTDAIVMRITDSGSGIPESIRIKLMQPFFTTKEVGKGTGLGLSISKGIIEGHAGTLTINSTCTNTQFVVELPRAQPNTAANPDESKDESKKAA